MICGTKSRCRPESMELPELTEEECVDAKSNRPGAAWRMVAERRNQEVPGREPLGKEGPLPEVTRYGEHPVP